MNIRNELLAVVDALNEAGMDYAVCGGLAVVIHGYLRLTDDIDILIEKGNVDGAKSVVRPIGFRLSTPIPLVFNRGKPNEAIVHRASKFAGEEHLILDLMEVTPALRQVWSERLCLRWEGRNLWVVSPQGLAQMKRGTGRKQDEADLENLGLDG